MQFHNEPPREAADATRTLDRASLLRALEVALGGLRGLGRPDMARLGRHVPEGADMAEIARAVSRGSGAIARAVSLSADEVAGSLGVELSVLFRGSQGWVVAFVQGLRGPRALCIGPAAEQSTRASARQLRRLMGEGSVPTVVLQPRFGLESLSAPAGGSRGPWSRLRAFMALERAELFALIIYAAVLGALSLAVPVAAQVLVNSIAFSSLLQPLVVLSILLLGVLGFSGAVHVLEAHAVEVLQRRVFVRVAEDFARRLPLLRFDVHDRVHAPALVHKFFEIVGIQKTMGPLLLDGLGLVLQTAVGMVLLAFYHPILLAFDVGLVVALVMVVVLGHRAVPTAVVESKAKYNVAAWLEQVAAHPVVFARESARIAAAVRADSLTRDYLAARRQHYARVLRQRIAAVGVQVVAMGGLLGLGGWLVMRGQLTLGQLVAAELVVSAIGVGFIKLGKQLEAGYDLIASLDKVGGVLDLPWDWGGAGSRPGPGPVRVTLRGVRVAKGTAQPSRPMDAELVPRARVRVTGHGGVGGSALLELLAGLREPAAGSVRVECSGGVVGTARDLADDSWLLLADEVVEGTILDNLRLGAPQLSDEQAWAVLGRVSLRERVARFERGIHTPLLAQGQPLSDSEVARLCLARALAAEPKVLLVDGALDDLGLDEPEFGRVLDEVFGPDMAWTTVVVTRQAAVARRCSTELAMGAAVAEAQA